jgi:uncharacterized OB-fold protein
MYRTDDPVRDAERYFSKLDEEYENGPKCEKCGEPLDAFHYYVEDEHICEECLHEHYWVETIYD